MRWLNKLGEAINRPFMGEQTLREMAEGRRTAAKEAGLAKAPTTTHKLERVEEWMRQTFPDLGIDVDMVLSDDNERLWDVRVFVRMKEQSTTFVEGALDFPTDQLLASLRLLQP